ncbi:hypothetical protein KQS06HV_50341 [Klebsiella quasipneumoniae subsp. similipneumoniae]|nr:hypothetical protein KQS06HV_50341 [Klebsiella quasipneumoniae subsp. similipneumoniae]
MRPPTPAVSVSMVNKLKAGRADRRPGKALAATRQKQAQRGKTDGPGFRGHLVYPPSHSWTASQNHAPPSTFRTIFVEQDARLNYDYPGVALAIPCPTPLLCRG